MPLSRGIWAGIAASVVLGLAGILLFFQYKDPMMIVFALQLVVSVWVVLLIVHVLRHGIPVRLMGDRER